MCTSYVLQKHVSFMKSFRAKLNFFFHFCISLDTMVPAHSRQALTEFFLLIQHLGNQKCCHISASKIFSLFKILHPRIMDSKWTQIQIKTEIHTVAPLSLGNTLHGPWWRPETVDGTKPYIYYIFPTHTYL